VIDGQPMEEPVAREVDAARPYVRDERLGSNQQRGVEAQREIVAAPTRERGRLAVGAEDPFLENADDPRPEIVRGMPAKSIEHVRVAGDVCANDVGGELARRTGGLTGPSASATATKPRAGSDNATARSNPSAPACWFAIWCC
jgi:hypothetical protein